ncbi:hypothetical protein BVY00_00745 [bacterium G20]|nr:hypothetical protein BVY00_00745 [bacterium G20]
MKKSLRERSPLVYILVALIPYSKPNLLLAFKPGLFFRELEKVSRYKQSTLKVAYWRAQQQGLIEQQQNIIAITDKGRRKIMPFLAENLDGVGELMVIFDIPEGLKSKRQKFRQILKEWQFAQIQKSVWATKKDYRQELIELIKELDIGDYVQLYESFRHFPE